MKQFSFAGIALALCLSVACEQSSASAGPAAAAEVAPPGSTSDAVIETFKGSSPQTVQLARIHGYGNPATGELWIRAVEGGEATPTDGIAGQAHAVSSFCSQDAEGLGADNDPNSHPTDAFEFFTVPEPGGCEDNDFDGVPDDNPMVCNDGMFGGVAFNAFDQSTCEGRLPAGADTRAGGAGAHSAAFTTDGVGCARQRVGNYTSKTFARVFLDIDVFNGDPTHYPYGFPFALGEDVDGTPNGSAQGAVQTPTTGRARPDSALGLWDFGSMAPGETADMWIFFRNGDSNDFTFTGFILGEVLEDCGDNDDDDCDGVDDNGCFDQPFGAACYHNDDCTSGSCSGVTINSLLGAAAVPGSSTLSDDIAGSCDAECGNGLIEGAEECDYGDVIPGDGCDSGCNWERGLADTSWGPTLVDDSAFDQGWDMVQVADGEWIVGGSVEFSPGDHDWTIYKTDVDGTLDTTFGTGGLGDSLHFAPGTNETVYCLGLQSDGKIIGGGVAGAVDDFAVARWDASGTLDATFGAGGAKVIDFSDIDRVQDCVVLDDDRILVVGSSWTVVQGDSGRLVMLNPDGSIDTTWAVAQSGVSGVGTLTAVPAAQIADGEQFTIAGTTFEFDTVADGVGAGAAVDISLDTSALDVALTMGAVITAQLPSSIRVMVENEQVVITHDHLGVSTITEAVADAGFKIEDAQGGSVVFDTGSNEIAQSVAIAGGGEFVVGGTLGFTLGWVARFTPAGARDTSFAPLGYVLLGSLTDVGNDVAVTGSGDILIVGAEAGNGHVVRVTSAGVVDTGFGSAGRVSSPGDALNAIALDGASAVVGGQLGTSIVITRLDAATGDLDTGFGAAGNAILDVTAGAESVRAIGFDALGQIIVSGYGTDVDEDFLHLRIAP